MKFKRSAATALASVLMLSACSTSSSDSGTSDTSGKAGKKVAAALKTAVQDATGSQTKWQGPTTGPKAQKGKSIVYVSQTQQNAGSAGVAKGLEEAGNSLGWDVKVIDGKGTLTGMVAALNQAIALKPDGIVLGSVPTTGTESQVKKAVDSGIAVVGWHASDNPGKVADSPLFTNVTSKPADIAYVAGAYAIVESGGDAQAIQYTDLTYSICREKDAGFKKAFAQNSTSKIIKTESFPFGSMAQRTPSIARANIQRYASKGFNWMIAINDGYFDYAIPALRAAGMKSGGKIRLIAAGDGSETAYERIRQGNFQEATIPEPLNEHGWIVADELNRSMAGEEPSNFVTPVHLVDKDNVDKDGGDGNVYEPADGYRDQYKKIWGIS